MSDIMQTIRAARERRGKESKQSKESPPVAPVPTPSPASPAFLPGRAPPVPTPSPASPAFLPGPVAWNQREVSKRTRASDELVVHLHVDGRDPEVQRAASMVESATATGDMEVLKYALAEFDVAVRRVGGKRFAKPA